MPPTDDSDSVAPAVAPAAATPFVATPAAATPFAATPPPATPAVVGELIARSRRLGADPRNTNFAGGNTSVKGVATDPVTGADAELLWVKGSGGDLGTLSPDGLAVLRLDRLRALTGAYRGAEHEDEMVGAFDFCLYGRGGAAPSIDTAMHALVAAPHVDHLHPDAGIALATAADGEALAKECFGDRVMWVPWRRPGFQLGLDIAAVQAANPRAIGVILGGHGITAWGATSDECEARSLEIIRTAGAFIAARGRDGRGRGEPFGAIMPGYAALPPAERRERAAALAPVLRGLASTDSYGIPGGDEPERAVGQGRRKLGWFTDDPAVLDFLAGERHPALAALGTSCPDHFLRTKIRPMLLDLPPTVGLAATVARLRELHVEYRRAYRDYYETYAQPDSPPMRGADPAIVLVPGVGMFSFGDTRQAARVAGEFYLNAINVMRGAETISRYAPIDEAEKFRIEYWALEEAKLARLPRPKPLAGRVAVVTGGGSGIGRAIARRLSAEGACVVVTDRDAAAAAVVADELNGTGDGGSGGTGTGGAGADEGGAGGTGGTGADEGGAGGTGTDRAVAVTVDVTDDAAVRAALDRAVLTFGGVDLVVNNAGLSISKPLLETTEAEWDLQHDVMAKGSFLVSRAAAAVLTAQGLGGDLIYVCSKNAVVAGPDNVAYGAAKADQAHQVRLLAAELGGHGIRVNGVNPDGVVRDSGIFAGGWGARRAAVYGVPEERLGAFYAQRTLLKREVLPEHVAAAVFVLAAGELSHTTGLHIPVDAGVAAAFLR